MSSWAIIPVKPFRAGKSRLASVLSLDERQALNRCLLKNTLDKLSNTSGLDQILVISRDAMALDLAAKMGAFPVRETSPSNLNLALERATRLAQEAGSHGVLILPADLPLLTSDDIVAILYCAGEPKDLVDLRIIIAFCTTKQNAHCVERAVIDWARAGAGHMTFGFYTPTESIEHDLRMDFQKEL